LESDTQNTPTQENNAEEATMRSRYASHLVRRRALVWLVPLALACIGSDVVAAEPTAPADKTLADLTRRWQGVWVVRDADYPGSVEAWNVKGDHVSVYDAKRGRVDDEKFALVSPCRVARTRVVDGKPDAVVTDDTFVFASDGLHVARAPAAGGFQRGQTIEACIGENVYRYDTHTDACARLDATGAQPPVTDQAECAIDHGPVSSSFVVRPMEGGATVRLDFYAGGALLSQALVAHIAEPRTTFTGAVRRADSLGSSN
jgi:hypothetical protein